MFEYSGFANIYFWTEILSLLLFFPSHLGVVKEIYVFCVPTPEKSDLRRLRRNCRKAKSKQMRAQRKRRGKKLYKWRINKLEIQFFRVDQERSIIDTKMERDRAGAKVIEIWEQ